MTNTPENHYSSLFASPDGLNPYQRETGARGCISSYFSGRLVKDSFCQALFLLLVSIWLTHLFVMFAPLCVLVSDGSESCAVSRTMNFSDCYYKDSSGHCSFRACCSLTDIFPLKSQYLKKENNKLHTNCKNLYSCCTDCLQN